LYIYFHYGENISKVKNTKTLFSTYAVEIYFKGNISYDIIRWRIYIKRAIS